MIEEKTEDSKTEKPKQQNKLEFSLREMILVVILVIMILVVALDEVLEDDDDDNDGGSGDVIYEPEIDPANFVNGVDNPYFPLTVGATYIYEADTEDGKEVIVVTVTNDTKVIMGITCVIVRDTVTIGGELFEDTYDWYAQDKDGNVWYMGEDSTEYEDGEEDKAGSWEAGKDGAKPGIIMMAKPLAGFRYRQEYYKGEAEDMGEVLSQNETITVALGTYKNCIMIKDINPFEPEVEEHKYYAEGIGVVAELTVKGGDERVELIEISSP